MRVLSKRLKGAVVIGVAMVVVATYALPIIQFDAPAQMLSGGYVLVDQSGYLLGYYQQPSSGSLAANLSVDPRFVAETHGLNYIFAGSYWGGGNGVSEEVLFYYHYSSQLGLRCNSLVKVIDDAIYVYLTTSVSYLDTLNDTSFSLGEPNMTITHESVGSWHCPASTAPVRYAVIASLAFMLSGHGTAYSDEVGYVLVP